MLERATYPCAFYPIVFEVDSITSTKNQVINIEMLSTSYTREFITFVESVFLKLFCVAIKYGIVRKAQTKS